MSKSFVLATALFFTASVGGLSFAQTDTTMPPSSTSGTMQKAPARDTTGTTSTTTTPTTRPSPAPQDPSTTGTPPLTPAPMSKTGPADRIDGTATPTQEASAATTGECRTRKSEGAACACLKEPTRVGVATASPTGGRNMCVMP